MKLLQQNHRYNYVNRERQINLNILPGTNSDFVPLFCLNKLQVLYEGESLWNPYDVSPNVDKIIKELFPNAIESKIYREIIAKYLMDKLQGYAVLNDLKTQTLLMKEIIQDYLEDKSFHIPNIISDLSFSNYENIFDYIKTNNLWAMGNLRTSNYLLNLGFMATYNVRTDSDGQYTVDFQPLFSFVVKSEHIKYLRLCYLTGTPVDTSVLELWITKGFEDKETPFKLMKMNYRKYLKEWVTENKIRVVEHDNLTSALFTQLETPALKTLKDRSSWLKEKKEDFFKHLIHKNNLEHSHNIILDYER
jgi:hypothetical protein